MLTDLGYACMCAGSFIGTNCETGMIFVSVISIIRPYSNNNLNCSTTLTFFNQIFWRSLSPYSADGS